MNAQQIKFARVHIYIDQTPLPPFYILSTIDERATTEYYIYMSACRR